MAWRTVDPACGAVSEAPEPVDPACGAVSEVLERSEELLTLLVVLSLRPLSSLETVDFACGAVRELLEWPADYRPSLWWFHERP